MSLVVASQLSLAYGPKILLDGASFSVGARDRVGLVGANGTGKSSLLRMLAGDLSADAGGITFSRGARAGYLPQEVAALPGGPLLDVVLASVPGRAALEARLMAVEAALPCATTEGDQLELSQALADLHAELDHFEEHYGRHSAERILAGLGFAPGELSRATGELSGGWKMRAALAALLLQDPDLLLLDEPTNHLDVPTLEWFDAFLRATRKALVLITHDREFLDRQVTRILALEPEGLRAYTGNYGDYRRQRSEEEERLLAQARRQEARRAELESFIERFGAKATKARQAQSRRKMLDRMEAVEVRERRTTLRFQFRAAPRSGRDVLRLHGLAKSFGPKVVYAALDATVLRGERIAVIGPNGAGKSTLLKIAAGELTPDTGEVRLGHGVVAGYYAQHHFERAEVGPEGPVRSFGALDPDRTVLDTLWQLAPDQGEAYVRGVAGAFLFSGDDVEKKVGVLSGGERARVALARLLLVPANFLILDEPTNHLDLESSEALIEALDAFDGTLLFVSHNRSFLNRLATRTWEVRGGGIVDCPGNLDDWLYHQRQIAPAAPEGPREVDAPAERSRASDRARRRAEAEARNTRYAREKPLRDQIARLEARIGALEREERAATEALADPELYQDFERARPVLEAQRAAKLALDALYSEWEEAQHRLAALVSP